MERQPLIAPAWRRAALVSALLGLAVFLSLAVLTFHAGRTGFDSWAFRVLPRHISPSHEQFLLSFTEPSVSVLLLILTAVLAASARRVDVVGLVVLGPSLGTLLVAGVVKPVVHRTLFAGATGTYPSGHETGVACSATVLLVAFGQLPLRRVARCALAVVLGGWVVVAAVALTRGYYHYATDTIGALGFSLALVLALAALLDRCASTWPGRRPRPVPVDEPDAQLTPRV